jgi:4a-hydroxytetrahydrobiopterin dehydratase
MSDLKKLDCVPCRKGEPTVTDRELQEYSQQVPDWNVVERSGENQLERDFKFKNFAQALEFTHKVGEAAEAQDHHPVITLEWGKVNIRWWTHAIGGLHRNDFIMASKTDQIYQEITGS